MRTVCLSLALVACAPSDPNPPAEPAAPVAPAEAVPSAALADTVVTVRGLFHAGFEASAFQPCDEPDEAWALRPDRSFSVRYEAIERRHVPARQRGTNIYVEATLTGTLRRDDATPFGHASACVGSTGGCTGAIRVTETHAMTFVAVDPEALPVCAP